MANKCNSVHYTRTFSPQLRYYMTMIRLIKWDKLQNLIDKTVSNIPVIWGHVTFVVKSWISATECTDCILIITYHVHDQNLVLQNYSQYNLCGHIKSEHAFCSDAIINFIPHLGHKPIRKRLDVTWHYISWTRGPGMSRMAMD